MATKMFTGTPQEKAEAAAHAIMPFRTGGVTAIIDPLISSGQVGIEFKPRLRKKSKVFKVTPEGVGIQEFDGVHVTLRGESVPGLYSALHGMVRMSGGMHQGVSLLLGPGNAAEVKAFKSIVRAFANSVKSSPSRYELEETPWRDVMLMMDV